MSGDRDRDPGTERNVRACSGNARDHVSGISIWNAIADWDASDISVWDAGYTCVCTANDVSVRDVDNVRLLQPDSVGTGCNA